METVLADGGGDERRETGVACGIHALRDQLNGSTAPRYAHGQREQIGIRARAWRVRELVFCSRGSWPAKRRGRVFPSSA